MIEYMRIINLFKRDGDGDLIPGSALECELDLDLSEPVVTVYVWPDDFITDEKGD